MKIIIWLCTLFYGSSVMAGTTNLPVLKERIEILCPGAEIVETEYREGFTEIEFICNGQKTEAGFDGYNQLVYTKTDVTSDEKAYEKIIKKTRKSYEGWDMDDFQLVETPDTAFYVVEMVKNGIEENVYFTTDGAYYRPANMSAGEKLNNELTESLYSIRQPPYNFSKPAHIFYLPELLREVSGIVPASDQSLYLVQDELGAVFEYNLIKEEVTEMLRFTDNGDFEDVATDGSHMFVLRSDGMIFKFHRANPEEAPELMRIPVQVTNLEGLFYEPLKSFLLMAGKNEPVNGKDDLRLVYQIHPDEKYQSQVWLQISIAEINKMLTEHYPPLAGLNYSFTFNPSAIAIHPLTGETFILSASDRLLAVYKDKELKEVFPLSGEMYYKPEGLAFSASGDLYLSSEGIKNGWLSGRIFMFKQDKF